ncbi:F-box domain-containing protein [Mycena kentingensis (nom. inval.)]|nr:F-box domain-containing protein [Mycena kentingensis (nom. inval.)]
MPVLGHLPLDVLVHIQACMQPLDILSLRQCSKTMKSAASHRTVWMGALRRICAENAIPNGTFPLDKMSLHDLVHAATSSSRLIRHALRVCNDTTDECYFEAIATRLFEPRLPRGTDTSIMLGTTILMRMIPGGRYFATATDTNLVCIWDVSYSPTSLINPCPVAFTQLPHQPDNLLVQSSGRGGVRLVVFYPTEPSIDIAVFEISLEAQTPDFMRVAHKKVTVADMSFFVTSLTPNRFTFHYDDKVTVWDFVQDSSATIKVSRNFQRLIVSPTSIVCDDGALWVFDMPSLHPTGSLEAAEVIEPAYQPMVVSQISFLFPRAIYPHPNQEDWLLDDLPVIFDIFGRRDSGECAFARCEIRPIANAGGPLPRALPVVLGVAQVASVPVLEDFRFMHIEAPIRTPTPRQFVRAIVSEHELAFNIASLQDADTPAGVTLTSTSACVIDEDSGWPGQAPRLAFDFDVFSGRLILQTESEIRVLDYLAPNPAWTTD